MTEPVRCPWCGTDPLYTEYHDTEWGTPVHDDHRFFEFLILEGAQAGLAWDTILKKREGYRKAFAGFDPKKVARFSDAKVEKLLLDPAIVRNRLKVKAAVNNARRFLEVQKEFGSFDKFVWSFVKGKSLRLKLGAPVPVTTAISDALSKDLKARGLKFVGSTICYSFMQAVGMVNDHDAECFRYRQVS